ncbi:unnamed protein product [Blepharisma stoltei]|uniref:Uncharacterized protein n=1 Tax=Blepharisma stoltei TaxID=1481888 RepID=A0AAU9IDY4_9CILI|nr:unnamed protein product [Blepharisma stoltei]
MSERTRAAIIDQVGNINTLGVKDIEISRIPENFVVIRTEFASISPGDELLYKGTFGYNFQSNTIGLQGSGTVIKSGGSVLANSLLNKRVAFMSFGHDAIGSFSELALTDANFVLPIRDDLSFEDAASAFTALTVEYIMSKIRRGNHRAVIQNAAASSIGKAVIKYCNYYGIETINIVRRDDQIEILRSIGAENVSVQLKLGGKIGWDNCLGNWRQQLHLML